MKNVPIGAGFKKWTLAQAGYVYAFFPHSNKCSLGYTEAYKGKLMSSSAVVASLLTPYRIVEENASTMALWTTYFQVMCYF